MHGVDYCTQHLSDLTELEDPLFSGDFDAGGGGGGETSTGPAAPATLSAAFGVKKDAEAASYAPGSEKERLTRKLFCLTRGRLKSRLRW